MIPWVEKYRPNRLDEVVMPKKKLLLLREFFQQDDFPNFLFFGPPGVGKTSCISACAQEYYGKADLHGQCLELNASDDRGIDVVRTKIKDFTNSRWSLRSLESSRSDGTNVPTTRKPKLIILDEVDGISPLAQSALLVEMENNMENARFCLICNDVNKLNLAILSRCLRLRFSPLTREQISERLTSIALAESLHIDESGISAIVELSKGDMRSALNVLQQMSLTQTSTITETDVYKAMSIPLPQEIVDLVSFVRDHSIRESFTKIYTFALENGYDANTITNAFHMYFLTRDNAVVLSCLAKIETRIANECTLKIQLGYLVATLKQNFKTE